MSNSNNQSKLIKELYRYIYTRISSKFSFTVAIRTLQCYRDETTIDSFTIKKLCDESKY